MDKLELRRLIFDLFENARILFNEYYNGKEEYTDDDLEKIYELTSKIYYDDIINIETLIEEGDLK